MRRATLVAGAVLVGTTILVALLSFVWTPYDPTRVDPTAVLQPPFGAYLLGMWGLPFPMVEATASPLRHLRKPIRPLRNGWRRFGPLGWHSTIQGNPENWSGRLRINPRHVRWPARRRGGSVANPTQPNTINVSHPNIGNNPDSFGMCWRRWVRRGFIVAGSASPQHPPKND